MDRITDKHLDALCERINKLTRSPLEPYTKQPDGRYKANIGNHHIDHAYGGVALERMASDGGGVTVILTRGTKRDLYERMHAYLMGLEARQHANT